MIKPKQLPNRLYSNLALVVPKVVERNRAAKLAEIERERKNESRIQGKVEQVDRVLTRLEARDAELGRRIKALQAKRSIVSRRIERVEERALEEMKAAGLQSVVGLKVKLIAKPCPDSVVVDDESLIPAEWTNETTITSPDKVLIKAALKHDPELEIPGVHLAQRVTLQRK